MIEAKISGDGKGVDHCNIFIEEEYSEDGLLHLFAQLTEMNNAILETFVKSGFSPEQVSSLICPMLLHNITDFRTLHDIRV